MSPLMIYIPQNGAFLKTTLDAMVTLLNTPTYYAAKDIISILAVGMVGYQYVSGKKIQAISCYVLCSFLLLYGVLGIRTSVAVIDMQTADSAGEALTVDNVPLGVAMPAALISGMGYGITKVFSTIFHMPNDLDYTKTGMLFGARTFLAATNSNLSMSPELSQDLSAYIRQCVFAAKLLGSQEISASQLKHSPDLIKLYFEQPSPIYRVLFHDGSNLSCIEAAALLKPQLNSGIQKQLVHLAKILTQGQEDKFRDGLASVHSYFMKVSKDAANILTQNILINATRDSAQDAFAFAGADAQMMNFTNTTSLQKMHVAEANSFWMAGYRLPYFMTVFWIITLCIFPLVLLIALLPSMHRVYVIYLQSQMFLWLWPPMFIIIHFLVSLASSITLTLFGTHYGGVTFSTIDSLASINSGFAYTAGGLAISVPFIAFFIVKGLPSVLSTASQHLGGMVQSMSTAEAQSVTQGNISMASYSGWNMNYDNHHAHKWDTNYQHLEGRATVQADNGALVSQGLDGSRVINAQGAISQMATRLHASDRISSSLHQNANQSFQNSENHRTSADYHYQQALSGMSQFNETDVNETREGTGINKTVSNSLNEDIRQMHDAVNQYNQHHDRSGHVSLEAALTGKFNGGLAGAVAKVALGGSIEASAGVRTGSSSNNSVQAFYNSSEGQSFSNAFNHLEATAKTQHLDTHDANNLSQSEQIAAHLSQGHALADASSTEYTKGLQYQQAASEVKEHASSMDSALDQVFYEWVVSRHGIAGEKALRGADAQSLKAQQQLADEFMRSAPGKNALAFEVNQLIHKASPTQMKQNYEGQRQNIMSQQKDKVDSSHAKGSSWILEQSQKRHLHMLSDDGLQKADELRKNSQEDLFTAYERQEKITHEAMDDTKGHLKDRHQEQKNEFVHNKRFYKEGQYE
jgi:conjugal transfer mating pair stabilization protein TraG